MTKRRGDPSDNGFISEIELKYKRELPEVTPSLLVIQIQIQVVSGGFHSPFLVQILFLF